MSLTKILGFVLLFHAAVSLIRYRKHLQFHDRGDEFTIPLDVCFSLSFKLINQIFLEIIAGFAINIVFGILFDKQFKNIHEQPATKTFDQSLSRPNFKLVGVGRGRSLVGTMKQKLGNLSL